MGYPEQGNSIGRVRLWAMSVILLGVTNAVLGLVGVFLLIPVLLFALWPQPRDPIYGVPGLGPIPCIPTYA